MLRTQSPLSTLPRRGLAALVPLLLATAAYGTEHGIEALRQANAALDAALRSRDIDTVMALHATESDITVAHPRDRSVLRGPAAVRRSWEEAFKPPIPTFRHCTLE
jgi:ketosteroid isomerase-like protein